MPSPTGTLLFRTVQHPRAADIADQLARRGILVRRFDAPAALRFGLPPDETGWQRLEGALSELTYLIDQDRKSTRLNSSHVRISYAVFCLKKKKTLRVTHRS